jgi:hypothetical protein
VSGLSATSRPSSTQQSRICRHTSQAGREARQAGQGRQASEQLRADHTASAPCSGSSKHVKEADRQSLAAMPGQHTLTATFCGPSMPR